MDWNQFKMNSDKSLLEPWNTWLSLLKHPFQLGVRPQALFFREAILLEAGEVSQQRAGAHELSFPSYTEMIQFKNLRTNPAQLLPSFHGAVFFSRPLKLYPL